MPGFSCLTDNFQMKQDLQRSRLSLSDSGAGDDDGPGDSALAGTSVQAAQPGLGTYGVSVDRVSEVPRA